MSSASGTNRTCTFGNTFSTSSTRREHSQICKSVMSMICIRTHMAIYVEHVDVITVEYLRNDVHLAVSRLETRTGATRHVFPFRLRPVLSTSDGYGHLLEGRSLYALYACTESS
jgi:hypothetical protein